MVPRQGRTLRNARFPRANCDVHPHACHIPTCALQHWCRPSEVKGVRLLRKRVAVRLPPQKQRPVFFKAGREDRFIVNPPMPVLLPPPPPTTHSSKTGANRRYPTPPAPITRESSALSEEVNSGTYLWGKYGMKRAPTLLYDLAWEKKVFFSLLLTGRRANRLHLTLWRFPKGPGDSTKQGEGARQGYGGVGVSKGILRLDLLRSNYWQPPGRVARYTADKELISMRCGSCGLWLDFWLLLEASTCEPAQAQAIGS